MRIAALGGGIAGLSAAIALRLRGHEVEVYERDEAPRGVGAGIVCWPNATFVLRALGLGEVLERIGGRVRAMRRLDAAGSELGVLDLDALERGMGAPSYSILRRDLHQALLERALELGARVEFGCALRALEPGPAGGVCARVGEEGRAVEADLLLGAEGRMRSLARRYVSGSDAPVYQGFVNWVGVFEGPDELFADLAVRDYWGLGQRFGIVPISPRAAYWAGGEARAEPAPKQRSGLRELLLERFAGWPEPIQSVLRGAERAQGAINEVYVYDHDPLEVWHRDNLLLIGDAAHAALPTSGQGACQALEDAWHLAQVLEDAPELERACAEFTALRRGKTSAIAEGGRRLAGALFATDPARCAARDADARGADYAAMAAGMAGFWSSGLPG